MGSRGFSDHGHLIVRDNFIPRSTVFQNGWRSGYARPSGAAFSLSFGFYLNDRYAAPCYVSPWYLYSGLPPYIPASRVIIANGYSCNWTEGALYRWDDDRAAYRNIALDDAIDALRAAYQNVDLGAVNSLIPSYGEVAISTDRHYNYSLRPDEFRDMLSDGVRGVQTINFRIQEVRRYGSMATVTCIHRFRTPDGATQTVYQEYRLREQSGRFVISDFNTEQAPAF